MSEKEEALEHLSAIKSALVDKDSFFPYNYNALIVWGVIGMIMTLFIGGIYKESVLYGTVFSIILMSVGFVIEGFLTKKINADYDIDDCTKRQKFIAILLTGLTFFSIAMSALLAKYDLIVPIYILWIFLMGVGHYSIGFVLNIKLFTLSSYMKMVVSILLIIAVYFMDDLGDVNTTFFYFVQGISFAFLGVVPIMIGRKLKKVL